MKNLKLFEQFTGIEDKPRLSKEVIELLNEQIKNEVYSSHIYRAMSCWMDDQGYPNGCKLFMKYSDEELTHAKKIYGYLFDKNCKAKVPAIKAPNDEFDDVIDILNKSLEHEIEVSEDWENIAETAKNNKDNTTMFFAEWFLGEQTTEEIKFRDALFQARLDMPKWKLEELFKQMLEDNVA